MKALTVLVFNSGSSSLKFGFYLIESSFFEDDTQLALFTETLLNASSPTETFVLKTLFEGAIEIAVNATEKAEKNNFYIKDGFDNTLVSKAIQVANHVDAALTVIRFIASFNTPKPDAIAHRIVHGGPNLRSHCFINDKLVRQLARVTAFAPIHNQAALEIITFTRATFKNLPHVACFDTAFHAQMSDVARTLPIAKELQLLGVMRYGFHGISCESVLAQLQNAEYLPVPNRLIIAHLGSGASVTAVKNGLSVDTSMGLTPSGGVMMATRSGDIDPGILIYLMREKNYTPDAIEALINHQSGLLGVSGLTSDMRLLHTATATNTQAQLAIKLFCYGVAKQIGAMVVALNGLDALIFTGGIGENDALIRHMIVEQLSCFGLSLDSEKNQQKQLVTRHEISFFDASLANANNAITRSAVYVVASQENRQMARHAAKLLHVLPT